MYSSLLCGRIRIILRAMELLDQLERRIGALLDTVEALREENASLKEAQARDLAALADESHVLRQELETERAQTATALTRIEALVERIKEQTDQE